MSKKTRYHYQEW